MGLSLAHVANFDAFVARKFGRAEFSPITKLWLFLTFRNGCELNWVYLIQRICSSSKHSSFLTQSIRILSILLYRTRPNRRRGPHRPAGTTEARSRTGSHCLGPRRMRRRDKGRRGQPPQGTGSHCLGREDWGNPKLFFLILYWTIK